MRSIFSLVPELQDYIPNNLRLINYYRNLSVLLDVHIRYYVYYYWQRHALRKTRFLVERLNLVQTNTLHVINL